MLKLVYCVTRRAELEPAAFRRIWLEEHGPLVRSFAEALHALRYVQSHTVDPALNEVLAASRGMEAAYDGITEIWFPTRAAFEAALDSPAGQAAAAALIEDERRFIDFARSRLFLTEEHTVF